MNNSIKLITGETYNFPFSNGCGGWHEETVTFYGILSIKKYKGGESDYHVFIRYLDDLKVFTIAEHSVFGYYSDEISHGFVPLNWGKADTIKDAINSMNGETSYRLKKSMDGQRHIGKLVLTE